MSKKYYYLLSPLFVSVLCIFLVTQKDSRQEYEAFLKNHKYHPSNFWNVNVEEIPKRDRPDLAWQQNYLMTMDPALKRPAPERLQAARTKVREYFSSKARTGTAEFPWIERGPSNVGGRTRAIAWDPNDPEGKKVWAGGVTGGLWYTTDIYNAAIEWTPVDDFWANISITSIAFDPTNTNIMYVGTGEGFGAAAARGAGIWKSADGGATWSQLSASAEFYYVNDLVVRDEAGTGILYAGISQSYYEGWHGSDGLQRSTDGGTTFTQVMQIASSAPYAIFDLELATDNTLWAASGNNAYGEGGGSIFYSSDGTNWTLRTQRTGARVEIACAPSNANVVYALVESDTEVHEVLKTTDQGASWTLLTEPADADTDIPSTDFSRGQAWYDLILGVDPNNENVVLAGGIDLFKSSDGGTSWNQISHWYGGFGFPNVHADQHAIVYKPESSTDVLFGHDGGIDLSTDINAASPSFTNRNNKYNVTQFYACAIHPEAGRDYFLAGAQDNGSQQFDGAGLVSTKEVTGGDGAFCFIDQQDGNIQLTSYVQNSYYLSTDGGSTFLGFEDDQNSGQFINPADYDDHLGILYTAADENSIGRFTNVKSGNPSRSDFSVTLGEIASHLRVSPHTTTSTTLFVGTTAGRLFKITEANTASPSPVDITGDNFPAGNLSCVEIGATENDLLVTFSNYGVTSVFESKDGGATWTDKEGDLPDMPVRWALYNPGNSSEVILATDLGVWRTTNMESTTVNWVPSNIGLANVRVDMLQIRESDYEVIAATHGRGLYSSSGFMSDGIRAVFSASATEIQIDGTVSFTDNSTGAVSWSWTFEGGTPATSTEQNPTVTYSTLGTFDVTLTVTDSNGNEDTKTSNDFINVVSEPEGPCSGEQVLTAASGTIEDGSGTSNYQDNLNCTWTIQPPDATSITLSFAEFAVEDGYDFVLIYDGDDLSTATDSLTGTTLPEDIVINSSSAVIVFKTDELENKAGWKLNYTSTVVSEPEGSCSGEKVLTTATGTIEDGSGTSDYGNNLSCTWTIQPPNATSITLSFAEFAIEDGFDFVLIYDGDDLSTATDSLTGYALPEDIVINSSSAVIVFVTDDLFTDTGWKLNYSSSGEASLPDLALENLAAEPTGTTLEVALTASNTGDAELTSGVSLTYYLSDDNAVDDTDTELARESLGAIAAGGSEDISESIEVPVGLAPGDYFLIVIADEDNQAEEKDETNNQADVAITLEGDALGTSTVKHELFKVYPVPATAELNIASIKNYQGYAYNLVDVSGKTVLSGRLEDQVTALNISHIKSGTYQLILKGDRDKRLFRIIKI